MYLVVLIAMILYISLRHITAEIASYLEVRLNVFGSTYCDISLRQITAKMTSYLEARFYVLGSTYRDDFIHFFSLWHCQND